MVDPLVGSTNLASIHQPIIKSSTPPPLQGGIPSQCPGRPAATAAGCSAALPAGSVAPVLPLTGTRPCRRLLGRGCLPAASRQFSLARRPGHAAECSVRCLPAASLQFSPLLRPNHAVECSMLSVGSVTPVLSLSLGPGHIAGCSAKLPRGFDIGVGGI